MLICQQQRVGLIVLNLFVKMCLIWKLHLHLPFCGESREFKILGSLRDVSAKETDKFAFPHADRSKRFKPVEINLVIVWTFAHSTAWIWWRFCWSTNDTERLRRISLSHCKTHVARNRQRDEQRLQKPMWKKTPCEHRHTIRLVVTFQHPADSVLFDMIWFSALLHQCIIEWP